jgi:hypothetical protein
MYANWKHGIQAEVLMHTTVKTGKMVTSKDHVVCATFAILLTLSVKLALIPSMVWSIIGWYLVWKNWETFNAYCYQRRDGLR